jgi:hypothetical protein
MNSEPETLIAAAAAQQIDELPAECPYLTKDEKGNTVLSWVRMINDSTTAFCYAVKKEDKTFSVPIVIPNSANIQPHGENLPKIVFKPSGEIIALWGIKSTNLKNKYSGMVYYTQSFDKGVNWTIPRKLVNDTAGYDQRYYDVAVLPNGEAGVIWLDNRKSGDEQGSALYFTTTSGKDGFVGEGRLISEPACQCCRTVLYVDKKGEIHALYRGIIQDSIRDMVHIISTDGGKTFSAPKRISEDNWVLNACPHTGPTMTENNDGIHFAWFTGGKDKGAYYTSSTDNGQSFHHKDSVSVKGSHPQIASCANGDLLIVWDEMNMIGNKMGKRIGVQKRTADGKALAKEYITSDDSNAGFPVVSSVSGNSFVVAYSVQKDDRSFVSYKIININ